MELTIGLIALVGIAAVLYYSNKSKEKNSVSTQPEPEVAPYKVEPAVTEVVTVTETVQPPPVVAEPVKEVKPKQPKKPAAAKKPATAKAAAKKTKTKKSV